jgi:hypothetical protein
MKLRLVHPVQHRTIDVALTPSVENAGDAAHILFSTPFHGVAILF